MTPFKSLHTLDSQYCVYNINEHFPSHIADKMGIVY